jgi:monoamine oxidase
MAADGDFTTRFGAPVANVEHDAREVAVRLRDGTELAARAAIIAVPLNVLGAIAFSPALIDGAIESGIRTAQVTLRGLPSRS